MLLWLHESLIADLEEEGARSSCAIIGLEYIALGFREGKHLLFANRPLLTSLASYEGLEDKAKHTFGKLLGRFSTQLGPLRQMPAYRVEVVSSSLPLEARITGSVKVVRVPISHFQDSSSIQETVLLAENERDARLYETMAWVYAQVKRFTSVKIRARGVGGGGDTTADHYGAYQSSKDRFCLCIVDSDKLAPEASHGETAGRVAATDDPNQPLCEFLTTEVRELENSIPTNLYSEALVRLTNRRDRMKAVEALELIERSEVSEVRNYVDLKRGTNLGSLLSCSKGSPVRRYWDPRLRSLVSTTLVSDKCVSKEACTAEDRCLCWVVPGMGDKVLDDVLLCLKRMSPSKIEQSLSPETRSEWMRLGERVLAWCCGAHRNSTSPPH